VQGGILVISKRSRGIILDVIDGDTTTGMLAKKYHVTSRMIINDLESIDYFLETHGFRKLSKSAIGRIKRYEDTNNEVLALINSDHVVISSYLPEERILEIVYLLSVSDTFVKLDTLSENLGVCKSTITKDVEKLREMCANFNVDIVGNKQGLRLSGLEFDIRILITSLFISYMDTYAVFDTTRILLDKDLHTTYKVFWRIFENIDITIISDCIEIIKNSLSINLQDHLYLYVSGLISLMIKRNRLGHSCSTATDSSLIARETANQIIDYLTNSLDTDSFQVEFAYINHILEVSSIELYKLQHKERIEFAILTEKIVQCVYEKFNLKMIYESELTQLISEEIRLIYMEKSLRIPVIKNIVNIRIPEYDHVYDELRKICIDNIEVDFSEDHLWRMAAHVIDIRNRNQYTMKKSVIIVSDKPHQMAVSLKKNLMALFNVNVVGIVGLGQLRKYMKLVHIDHVISTVNIGIIEDIDCPNVKVHPMLSDEDIKRLKLELPLNYIERKSEKLPDAFNVISNQIVLRGLADERVFINTVSDILLRTNCVLTNITDFLEHSFNRASKFGFVINETLLFSVINHHMIESSVLILGELINPIEVNGRSIRRSKLIITQQESCYLEMMNVLLEEENEKRCS
jgi:transcriptional antiterminator